MKKTHPIAVRLDQDVKDILDARSADEDRSLSWLVNSELRKAFGLSAPASNRGKPARR
jgi:hypothetical protein